MFMERNEKTKKVLFGEIKDYLVENEAPAEWIALCDKEIEVLNRPRKPKKESEADEKLREVILNYITENPAKTITEIHNDIEECSSPQKAIAMVRKLIEEGKVYKEKVGKATLHYPVGYEAEAEVEAEIE